jgi:hypothetical protein
MPRSLLACVLVLAACRSAANDPQPQHQPVAGQPPLAPGGALVPTPVAPAPLPAPAPAAQAAYTAPIPSNPPAVAAGGPAGDCGIAVARVFALMRQAGNAVTDADEQADLQQCQSAPWPAPVVSCIAQMSSLDQLGATCFKAAFPSGLELSPQRRFETYEAREGANPPAMTVDGDWSTVAGWEGCGVIVKIVAPATAYFAVCNDKVIAGPMTTPQEITSFYEQVSKWQSYSNDLRRSIQASWTTGGNYRWVKRDRYGNIVY